jgi:anti-sigma factor RsiW
MSNNTPMRPTLAVERTCEQVTALLVDYVLGEMESATWRAVEAHLRHCRECRAFLATYQQTIAVLRSGRCEELPEALLARVQQFLHVRIAAKPHR